MIHFLYLLLANNHQSTEKHMVREMFCDNNCDSNVGVCQVKLNVRGIMDTHSIKKRISKEACL